MPFDLGYARLDSVEEPKNDTGANGRPGARGSPRQLICVQRRPNLTNPGVGNSRPVLDKSWHDLLQHESRGGSVVH